MGRRDAVQVILEVNDRCRHYLPNLAITYSAGWEARGNGTRADYEFGNVHHTGSATSLARPFPTQNLLEVGRPDLGPPLTNYATPACTVEAPRLHVVAANPANHAGASRRSGPVPALKLYNPKTLGNEVDYAGSVPMLAGQLLVAQVWTRAVADVLGGGDVEHVRAHAETSVTGKWDPGYAPGRTINMDEFRRAAAALLAPGSAPAPTPEQEFDVSTFIAIPPGSHVSIPRPQGGTVNLTVAFDDNGIGWRPTDGSDAAGHQLVRASVHETDSGLWRALYPPVDGRDGLTFWIPTGVPVSLGGMRDYVEKGVRRYDDLAVVRNMHPAYTLGLNIDHR